MKTNIAVLISGGGSNLQAIIDAVAKGSLQANICVVVSSNADAYGLERAKQHNIKTFVAPLKQFDSKEARDAAILKTVQAAKADYIVLAGYLGILTPIIIEEYPDKIINIHPSLLPKFGGDGMHGLAVHKAVIAAGEKVSGASVHFVDGGVDTGKVIAQDSLEVLEHDTPESLQKRILENIEHKLLVDTLAKLCE